MGKIAVLGLGESLSLYGGDMAAIGVNDIWSKYKSDYVVCLDTKSRFDQKRLDIIESCEPIKFYSQLRCWENKKTYEEIYLQIAYPKYVCQLDTDKLPKSLCSPFVAAAIAYKYFKADEIHLFGVDMVDHPLLKGENLDKIILHFSNLNAALKQKGVKLIVHGNGVLQNVLQ